MRRFYACFVAGAIGAIVSVITRMRDEDRISLDDEVGELLIVLLGSFRPLLGAIFGVVAYFAIEGGIIGLTAPTGHPAFFYYALFAFLAGFSERFAHVILGKADLAVSKSGSASEAPVQTPPSVPGTPGATSPGLATGAPANGGRAFLAPLDETPDERGEMTATDGARLFPGELRADGLRPPAWVEVDRRMGRGRIAWR